MIEVIIMIIVGMTKNGEIVCIATDTYMYRYRYTGMYRYRYTNITL